MSPLGWILTKRKQKLEAKLKASFRACGEKVIIRERCQFNHNDNIEIGNNVMINRDCTFSAHGGIKIGNGVVFAHCVDVFTGEHNYDSHDLECLPFDERFKCAPVEIGDYAWIGSHVVIMPGVKIGRGSVIGAASVVTKNVPDYAIAVGNPAKTIKYRNKERFDELAKIDASFVRLKR